MTLAPQDVPAFRRLEWRRARREEAGPAREGLSGVRASSSVVQEVARRLRVGHLLQPAVPLGDEESGMTDEGGIAPCAPGLPVTKTPRR